MTVLPTTYQNKTGLFMKSGKLYELMKYIEAICISFLVELFRV